MFTDEEENEIIETLEKQWGDSDNLINDLICMCKDLRKQNKSLLHCNLRAQDYIQKHKTDKILPRNYEYVLEDILRGGTKYDNI